MPSLQKWTKEYIPEKHFDLRKGKRGVDSNTGCKLLWKSLNKQWPGEGHLSLNVHSGGSHVTNPIVSGLLSHYALRHMQTRYQRTPLAQSLHSCLISLPAPNCFWFGVIFGLFHLAFLHSVCWFLCRTPLAMTPSALYQMMTVPCANNHTYDHLQRPPWPLLWSTSVLRRFW